MTMFFDTFFGDVDRIRKKEFDELLKQIPELSKEEINYLKEVFKGDLSDGLTLSEVKQKIERLSHNYNDSLDSFEVKKVKEKLLEKF